MLLAATTHGKKFKEEGYYFRGYASREKPQLYWAQLWAAELNLGLCFARPATAPAIGSA